MLRADAAGSSACLPTQLIGRNLPDENQLISKITIALVDVIRGVISMVVVAAGTAFGIDAREANVSGYANLTLTDSRSNYASGDYRNTGFLDLRVEFYGTGFVYNSNGEPVAGIIHSIRETYAGQLVADISSLSLPVSQLRYWVYNGLDSEALASIYGGNDSITGSPLGDYFIGYGGADRFDLRGGDDQAYGGAGNDVIYGGLGTDTAVLAGSSAAFTVVTYGNVTAAVPLDGATLQLDGLDKFYDVEQIAFQGDFFTRSTGPTNFQPLNYIASYADLSAALGVNALAGFDHYTFRGLYEGRSVSFSGYEYLASYSDLQAAFGLNSDAAAAHYIRVGRAEGRQVDFDGLSYIASYGDLTRAFGANADAGALHYLSAGRAEGRTVTFDPLEYTASYRDLISAFGLDEQGSVTHYLTRGLTEGRQVAFDGLQYIASYGDLVRALGADEHRGAEHYIVRGNVEGRVTDHFNEAQYLANYGDLRAAFGSDGRAATIHYIEHGFAEGRTDDPLPGSLDFML